MTEIILSHEQAEVIATATEEVWIRDPQGNVVATVMPALSHEESQIVAEAKRRLTSEQSCYTTAEVLGHLDALKRFESSDGLSQEEVLACAREVRALPMNDQHQPDAKQLAEIAQRYGVSVVDVRSLFPQPMC